MSESIGKPMAYRVVYRNGVTVDVSATGYEELQTVFVFRMNGSKSAVLSSVDVIAFGLKSDIEVKTP